MTEKLSLLEQVDLGMCTEEGEMFQALIRDGLIEARDTNKDLDEILDKTYKSVYDYFSEIFLREMQNSSRTE